MDIDRINQYEPKDLTDESVEELIEELHQAVQELLTKNHDSAVHILKQVNEQRKKLALQKPLRQELIAELRLEVVKLEEEIEGMLMERK